MRNAPTQERSRQTLDDIMEAANRLFYERGVEGTHIRDIAIEAGVSVGSLYRFFPNKEALVAEYVQRYMAALAEGLAATQFPEQPDKSDVEHIVSELVDRSQRARSRFVGYSAVRNWREPDTGIRPTQIVFDTELAMTKSLFERSAYDFPTTALHTMVSIIILSSYAVLEVVSDRSKAEGKRMLKDLKALQTGYILNSLIETPRRADL